MLFVFRYSATNADKNVSPAPQTSATSTCGAGNVKSALTEIIPTPETEVVGTQIDEEEDSDEETGETDD